MLGFTLLFMRNLNVYDKGDMKLQYYKNLRFLSRLGDIVLSDIHIYQELNKHGLLYISGNIILETTDKYMYEMVEGEPVSLILLPEESKSGSVEKPKTIFNGFVQSAEIKQCGNLFTVRLKAYSYTKMLDIRREYKSYQDIDITHENVILSDVAPYKAMVINNDKQKDEPIGKFTLKFAETAWQFVNRIASRHNYPLISDIKSDKIAFHVGNT